VPRCLLAAVAGLLLAGGCGKSREVDPSRLDWMESVCREALAKGPPKAPIGTVGRRRPRTPESNTVVIYGAEWCAACNIAVAYMRRRNIPFVEKDVEKDATARSEARALVTEAHVAEDSLPVIDVRGTVMVGFLPCWVELAWGARGGA
jgi:glutaredoxin